MGGVFWMSVRAIATFAKHSSVADIPTDLIFMGLLATYLSFSPAFRNQQRTEIRQRGILHGGTFLRWSRIESYAWQQARGESVVLTLRTKSLFRLPWRHRIVLTAAQRSPTNAILGKQLSPWPGAQTPDVHRLEETYRQMPVEELVKLAEDLDTLTGQAKEALNAELRWRGLEEAETPELCQLKETYRQMTDAEILRLATEMDSLPDQTADVLYAEVCRRKRGRRRRSLGAGA
jgi:hypothetical protein